LSIGSNEEATRLSGIDTDKYKIIAYTIAGIATGIAAIFWAASFTTVAAATGNGMELDAIAGVYIGGTSAAGGTASIAGSVIGAIMLVVIRSGLNFVLAKFNLNVNSTYVTYVLTGIIVVVAVLMDVIKNKNANKVKIDKKPKKEKVQG
ncbi:MAG: ABC transporter permease, partial [Clostridia bacterium]|nr:ABC transporter permease [Clostridia bacterium]